MRYQQSGHVALARELLTALMGNAQNQDARDYMNTLLQNNAILGEAYDHYEKGRYLRSVEICVQILKMNPNDFSVILLMGRCEIQLTIEGRRSPSSESFREYTKRLALDVGDW